MAELNNILKSACEMNASDVHLTVGIPPKMRLNGHLVNVGDGMESLTAQDTLEMADCIVNEKQKAHLLEYGELDMSYEISGLGRFRVNIFRQKDESAWKRASDGVVLYFESWKEILKNAVGLVLLVIGFYLVGGGIVYLILNAILTTAISIDSVLFFLIALISAFVIINAFKVSFLDSWITISVVNRYTQVTYNKQPQFDLYGKAKGWSRSFTKICSKAEADGVVVGAPVVAAGGVVNAAYQQPVYGQPVQQAPVQQPVYGQQMQQAPVQQPVYGQQMQQAPVQQPVYGQQMQQAPVQQPVYGQQIQQASVQQPVYGQPVQQSIPNNNQNGNL